MHPWWDARPSQVTYDHTYDHSINLRPRQHLPPLKQHIVPGPLELAIGIRIGPLLAKNCTVVGCKFVATPVATPH